MRADKVNVGKICRVKIDEDLLAWFYRGHLFCNQIDNGAGNVPDSAGLFRYGKKVARSGNSGMFAAHKDFVTEYMRGVFMYNGLVNQIQQLFA